VLVLLSLVRLFSLFFAQEENLDQGDDANPDEDHRADERPRDLGRLDYPKDGGPAFLPAASGGVSRRRFS
jgi:hypothetical protein